MDMDIVSVVAFQYCKESLALLMTVNRSLSPLLPPVHHIPFLPNTPADLYKDLYLDRGVTWKSSTSNLSSSLLLRTHPLLRYSVLKAIRWLSKRYIEVNVAHATWERLVDDNWTQPDLPPY
jgi:hypothetical protein